MEWKSLSFLGYNDLEISEFGELRKISKNFVYKKVKQNNGYLRYKINTVHKLVALAFIPNLLNKDTINHKDCNKENNHYSNLEWCTHSENMKHAFKNNLINMTNSKIGVFGRIPWNKGRSKYSHELD